jgi:hypothetical protein
MQHNFCTLLIEAMILHFHNLRKLITKRILCEQLDSLAKQEGVLIFTVGNAKTREQFLSKAIQGKSRLCCK